MGHQFEVKRISDTEWEIPQTGLMNVPGIVYTEEDPSLTQEEIDNKVSDPLEQVYNVAHLPGIIGKSMAMPDFHAGYGFPIGGVAAFDTNTGIVSPGGVGYDINCGVRLAVTGVDVENIRGKEKDIASAMFEAVPCGMGSKFLRLSQAELEQVAVGGVSWAVDRGYGTTKDITRTESYGRLPVQGLELSNRAIERGKPQLGSLGSGNHFLEVGYVDSVYDVDLAAQWGLYPGKVTILIHTGSRGFGHQICDDFLVDMQKDKSTRKVYLPDPQLTYAVLGSPMADKYLNAMGAAANYAFANRQIIMELARRAWEKQVRGIAHADQFKLLYDVAHNLAQFESIVDGDTRIDYLIHRKGATRALPPYHPSLPVEYTKTGQPVLIPGSMETHSYVLVGEETGKDTFYSTCHGAGRKLSRKKAKKEAKGRAIERDMEDKGIYVRHVGRDTLKEEHGGAYKDVNLVVDTVERAGIARKVARISPIVVVKG